MAVVAVDITCREPYADGQSFGDTGPYERLDGVLTYAVDPSHVANQAIVDLALAPRDDDGCVPFRSDFTLLVPRQPARGNRRLIVDIVNRGRKRVVSTFNRTAAPAQESREILPGDGFIFRHGYAVVSIGWQWDVYRSEALLGLEAPRAQRHGGAVRGQVEVEMRPNVVETTRLLADRVHRPYAAANLDDAEAKLLVREWKDGPVTELPRQSWRFARETDNGVVPSRDHVYLESGFQPGKMYHIVYTTDDSPIVGAGLLAVRDVAVWLRHAAPLNPVAGGFERVYGYGVSQTGRLLRHFIFAGLNLDEAGRRVYDGLLPHIAGGRRGEFNQRYGQPSQQHTPSFGHLFPFADEALTDAYTGRTDGLLERLRDVQAIPKILYTNSSAEYWRGDASLAHIDAVSQTDLKGAAESRLYHFAGTQHVVSGLPQALRTGPDGAQGRYPHNVVDYRPLLRAVLVNLDLWVSHGVEPPPSRHPRLDDGTAKPRANVLEAFDAIPGQYIPDADRLWSVREVELGPNAAEGVGQFPAQEGRTYPCYASAVDSDGNELGGIRLPDIEVPVATHTGWNPRAPQSGAPEQITPMQGFSTFFAATADEREAEGDRRASIQERYDSRDDYLQQVRQVATRLASERYLLAEDVELVISLCAAQYDTAMTQAATSHETNNA